MPTDRTHDISNTPYHVKDIEAVGHILNSAATAAFPNQGLSRYREVHALLLSWEDDDPGVVNEIAELEDVFQQIYRFEVDVWRIPSERSHIAVAGKVLGFLNDYESTDSLLIVYYGGHGSMNDDRQCVWSCPEFWRLTASYRTKAQGSTKEPDSPKVQWYGLQTMLEHARSDVLILLDCCAAASSVTGSGNGITEIIAACRFEVGTPGVGPHSFTRNLIDELKDLGRMGPFSTSMLHNQVFHRIRYYKPRYDPTADHCEMRKTPIYFGTSKLFGRSIKLEPLRLRRSMDGDTKDASSDSSIRGSAFSSLSISADQASTSATASKSSSSSLDGVWPDKEFACPKVLMSIALEEEQWLSPQHWADWIRSIPALVKYANIEGIYKSDSTLIMVSIPIAIWNLVPANPAIAFLGFSKSRNLLISHPFESDATAPKMQAGAVTELSERETDVKVRILQEQMLAQASELELKELRREAQTSKEEARRAWEELGRLEKEEQDRKMSLLIGEPTVVGGIKVEPIGRSAKSSRKDSTQQPSKERPLPHAPPTGFRTDDSGSDSNSSLDTSWSTVAKIQESYSTADISHNTAKMDELTDTNLTSRIDTSQTLQSQDAALENMGRWFNTTPSESLSPVVLGQVVEATMKHIDYVGFCLLLRTPRMEHPVERELWNRLGAALERFQRRRETTIRPTEGDKNRKDDLANEAISYSKHESLPNPWSTNTSHSVSSSPPTQWWCGKCGNGPMNLRFDSACLFCHRKKDYSAYMERPRTHK